MKEQKIITIITPTYNRLKYLKKTEKSLNRQTDKDFQWLIIDDGSNDGTKQYFDKKILNNIDLQYYYKINGGKHSALNYAQKYIKGKYVLILDSDDYLIDDAISIIKESIKKYDDNDKIGYICFQKGFDAKTPLISFPNGETLSNHVDFRINKNRVGDCCEIVRTNIFKQFPFPIHNGENFMSEGYLWANIAKEYNVVYINKILYICEYLDGGLTRKGRKLRIQNPLGGIDNCNAYLELGKIKKIKIKFKIKQAILYDCYSMFAKINPSKTIKSCADPVLAILLYIPSIFLYFRWKRLK